MSKNKEFLERYFQDLFEVMQRGDAREETYYSSLERLFGKWSEKKFHVTTLPKKTEAGNPDFRVWDGKDSIVGYVEAKIPGTNLDKEEKLEQLERYRDTFPNLILTDFFEFRLYRNGEPIQKVLLGRPFVIHELKAPSPVEHQEDFEKLLEQFFSFSVPKTKTARQLAVELAKRTRFLRDEVIEEELREEKIEGIQTLEAYLEAFRKHLIASLDVKDFSDLFAQTIAYGLFAARSRADDGFNRKLAHEYIPHTAGVLRKLFQFISSADLPRSMEWIIDDIAEVLQKMDVKAIIENFYKEGKGHDPVVHFYETFLAEYDPKERERRGVYYTPEPVVGYIVRSIHSLLKKDFGKKDGLADSTVTLLDPAAGTLTFPAEAVRIAIKEQEETYGEGSTRNLIRDHILKDFYAFELMMAPYAVGHLKIGLILEELGYKLEEDDSFRFYLTNTLDFEREKGGFPGVFERTLATESREALRVKEEIPIMIITGNPPYSGHSENKSKWILEKIEDYKKVGDEPLGEKNPKWLQDDYVKFFRFAQWKIEQTGTGILGFITNHAWIDNPTFRAMRLSLLNTFDELYILDLHGNARKGEKTPEGNKDENVFDIQAGVAISIFVKREKQEAGDTIRVRHADLWGLREEKYEWLDMHSVGDTDWEEVKPGMPHSSFAPRDTTGWKQYEKFWKIPDIFPINSVGIVTARDKLTIQWTEEEVWNTVSRFVQFDPEMARAAYELGKDAQDWKVKLAQDDLKETGLDKKHITPILYRPFDTRYTYYTGKSRGFHCRPRPEVMGHMLEGNLALLTCRQLSSESFQHAFVSQNIADDSLVSNKTRERGYVFPLYLHESKKREKEDGGLFRSQKAVQSPENVSKEANLSPKLIELLEKTWKKNFVYKEVKDSFHAIDVFSYIYAILYSNTYREKYKVFLGDDFPRVPFTGDHGLFKKLAELGSRLIALHKLASGELDRPIAKFEGEGDARVEKLKYDKKEKRVYVNKSQYFEGVPDNAWEYRIGGYQVLEKWLKDRRGRCLSAEEIKIYCRTVTSLAKTIEIQREIDRLYPQVEMSVEFKT